ncbi:MAG: endonuclease MutS2 [Treponema sp.]|nr:endonuclease MutS2 [Treponema sp.]
MTTDDNNINRSTHEDAFTVSPALPDRETLARKTEILLEYPRIMEQAASHALSEEAAAIIRELHPVFNDSLIKIKEIVIAIHSLIKSHNDEPRSWLPSIGSLIPKIETQGAVLDLDEVLALGLFTERGIELSKWLGREKSAGRDELSDGKKALYSMLDEIPDCICVAQEIFKIIDREGNLRDLPVLRAIRKRIASLERDLKNAVTRYCADDEYKRMLQSAIPSQRDGRAVLAVKANFRARIPGIVHEVSGSGQTVFVEPLEVVEKNNDILMEKRNLDAEIQKLLRELTEKISAHAENINKFHLTIIELECLRTRAWYSAAAKGHFAKNAHENMALHQARHPMLKKAVPINIEMNSVTRTLIITGPNTGGKTVALKTLGLFAMMNQSALALPLDEDSSLPVFDGIFADIGDEQSINQSLSTFSAHITKIAAITAYAGEKSLVLLDELGSGTDPQEGGAIAMAVLDHLIEKNARMIITTHHGILKHYGYTRQGVQNASVEFNARTLSPTYKIINGLPGESRALDIALSNGLDSKIVAEARKYIDEEKSDVSEMIRGLEEKQRELAGLEIKSAIEQKNLNEEKRKTDLKELKLRQKEAELKRESVGKLQQFLRDSRKTLENLVRELKEGEITREKTLKVKEFINELARNAQEESEALEAEELAINRQLSGGIEQGDIIFTPGMEVFAGTLKKRGVIIRADKKKSGGAFPSWLVEIGSLKISFPQNELSPAAAENQNVKTNTTSWAAEYGMSGNAVYELKLLGMRLDEATDTLRRQIEAASLSGLKNFAVIHGKGSGILQKGIHDYLKQDPAVADYYFARPELGGFGRTEVVLK